jgi:hypothetical protein
VFVCAFACACVRVNGKGETAVSLPHLIIFLNKISVKKQIGFHTLGVKKVSLKPFIFNKDARE